MIEMDEKTAAEVSRVMDEVVQPSPSRNGIPIGSFLEGVNSIGPFAKTRRSRLSLDTSKRIRFSILLVVQFMSTKDWKMEAILDRWTQLEIK